MRPHYESAGDTTREMRVAAQAARVWGMVKKLPFDYRADFVFLQDGVVSFFAEVKVRSETYDPFWISLKKWMALEALSIEARRPSLIIVQWPDEPLAYVPVLPSSKLAQMVWGGRADRGDAQDSEVMVQIPLSKFKRV